jgi:short-subunit dehydrogenase
MSNPKSIILTGASRGIGFAIARFLLKEGHKVFLVARSGEPLEKLKGEFKGQVEYLAADLSDFKVGDLLLYYITQDAVMFMLSL